MLPHRFLYKFQCCSLVSSFTYVAIASRKICETENLIPDRFDELVKRSEYGSRLPLRDELLETMESTPKILERDSAFTRISQQFKGFVETFYQGMH